MEQRGVQLPTYQHEDKTIHYPATTRPLPAKLHKAPHYVAFFDGGSAQKLGTGGFVVFGLEG